MKESRRSVVRLGNFVQSNMVYIAMAVALLAVGVLGAGRILSNSSQKAENKSKSEEMVEQLVTNEPDTRSTTTTTQKSTGTTSTKATAAKAEAPELYVFPLSNTVQKPFSATAPVYCQTMKHWSLHMGTDFAGEMGQKVKALAGGTVTKIEKDPLWGDVITIDHSVGVISRYCGVRATVREGDQVKVSEVIGTLTEIPCEVVQKPHLHLELSVDGTPIDPVEAIGKEVRYSDVLAE